MRRPSLERWLAASGIVLLAVVLVPLVRRALATRAGEVDALGAPALREPGREPIRGRPLPAPPAEVALSSGIALAPDAAPPGLARVAGGPTWVGLRTDELENLLVERPEFMEQRNALAASVPAHEVVVDDFWLMVSEVTQEQYAAFVRATGHRPPRSPVAEGTAPEWDAPAGAELEPVVFVDYQDAEAYARWAGLRLPTEAEYTRAVRGGSERPWPWGDEWDNDKYASTNYLSGPKKAYPVGSFPAGASEDGIFDLAGNVWEWTSSPFAAFPRYRMPRFRIDEGGYRVTVECLPSFDPSQRVCVGGSFQNAAHVGQVWIRRGTDRYQLTNGVGFRCAASATPAALAKDAELARAAALHGLELDFERALAWRRWQARPPRERGPGDPSTVPPPGYRVIERADVIAWVPVAGPDAASVVELGERSRASGPVSLGLLRLGGRPAELAPGVGLHLVGWCAAGAPLEPVPEGSIDPVDRAADGCLVALPLDERGRAGDPVVLELARPLGAATETADALEVLGRVEATAGPAGTTARLDSAENPSAPDREGDIGAWRLRVTLPSLARGGPAPGLVLEVGAP